MQVKIKGSGPREFELGQKLNSDENNTGLGVDEAI